MLHQRNSVQVRTDALKMALKKAKAGCYSCAQSYFDLARQHGATEQEISHAIDKAAETGEQGISRRDLLKLAIAVVAGVALGTELLPRSTEAASYFWGTDSESVTCSSIPQDFYIGRFGYGMTGSTAFFNTSAATTAGKDSTYIYWGLEGPDVKPKGTTPHDWGVKQARVAIYQWSNNPNAPFVGGTTVFADIEPEFGGWRGGARYYYNNQQVVQGFLNTVASDSSLHPGIYITINNWGAYFSTAFSPTQAFVLWISGCRTCSSRICAPGSKSCSSTLVDVEALVPAVMSTTLGGSQAVVWQYWISERGGGDFNVAVQSPETGFTPIQRTVTYHWGC